MSNGYVRPSVSWAESKKGQQGAGGGEHGVWKDFGVESDGLEPYSGPLEGETCLTPGSPVCPGRPDLCTPLLCGTQWGQAHTVPGLHRVADACLWERWVSD